MAFREQTLSQLQHPENKKANQVLLTYLGHRVAMTYTTYTWILKGVRLGKGVWVLVTPFLEVVSLVLISKSPGARFLWGLGECSYGCLGE